MYRIIFTLLAWWSLLHVKECKVCPTMRIVNDVESFKKLRNCSHIAGNLIIYNLQFKDESEFDSYVFPDLVTVSGLVTFFRVKHLTSIGQLFPNLHLIRGLKLVRGYSLVFYEVEDLRQIGTINLLSIENGGVRVEKCSNLCYGNTLPWQALGAQGYFNDQPGRILADCPECPERCKDSCWNSTHCMEIERNCHPECVGCSIKNSARHCFICKNFENDHECVKSCPDDKYALNDVKLCVTKKECEDVIDEYDGRYYFTHNANSVKQCTDTCPKHYMEKARTCWYCGNECVRYCSPDPVDTQETLKKLDGCTHINGSLIIRNLKTALPADTLLEEYLSDLRHINGTLQISRTKLTSLDFLRNVEYIGLNDMESPNSSYSIVIYDNPVLQKLWGFNITLKIKGKYSFHDNPLLCLSEIKKLGKATKVSYSSPIDVSEFSNGDQTTCVTDDNITGKFKPRPNSTSATILWYPPKLEKNDSYIRVTIYYKLDKDGSASFSNSTGCEVSDWNTVYITIDSGNAIANGSAFLEDLVPFSSYAYYVTLYISRGLDNHRQGFQSDMMHFQTLPDDPDGFHYFKLTPLDHHTINLNWYEPKYPNGKLSVYTLSYIELEDDYIFARNYCEYPKRPDGDKIDYNEDEEYLDFFNQGKDGDDDDAENKTALIKPDDCNCTELKTDIKEEIEIIKGAKSQLCSDIANSTREKQECSKFSYQTEKRWRRNSDKKYKDVEIPRNETSYNATGLKPYTLYVFYLKACNEPNAMLCSGVLQRVARTKKNPDADTVEDLKLEYHGGSSVNISWKPPQNPNTPIVAYRVNVSSTGSHTDSICISMEGSTTERMFQVYRDLTPGTHVISVQAESLAGLSKELFQTLDIPSPYRGPTALIAVLVSGALLTVGLVLGYIYLRKRRLDNIPLIKHINPDYEGPIYIQDEWEMDVADIDLTRELGRGNFGTVYQGLIKSRNLPCAVKICNETLDIHHRMEFLIEASAMKSFNNCYHVIKLLGVVSLNHPHYVVMELMERGDLKNFLRRIRDSSHNLTSGEIYRMAIEIADGMAYLSAKKFIHRDLAARNCMVAGDRTVKVGDFGMARDIYTTDYYRKGTKGLLPVRWMAPESLADGVFTTDSDVWSYGIVLWEIATLAEQPYQGKSNEQAREFVISRGRLSRPPECSDFLYDIMRQCWMWRPCDRPSFWDIVERLEDRVSEDFKLLSFVYSREASIYSRQRVDNPAALGVAPKEELLCHYNVSDEDIRLPVGGVPRRPGYLQASITHRRFSPPDDIY